MVLQQVARRWQRQLLLPQYRQKATLHHSVAVAGQVDADSSCHVDMVGPPDPASNIRPLRLREPTTEAEREVQELKLQMWDMNNQFWTQHNTQFKQEKAEFAEAVLQRKQVSGELTEGDDVSQVTSEELSVFYKEFLDKKYKDQLTFTRNWMALNLLLTWTQFKYNIKTFFRFYR